MYLKNHVADRLLHDPAFWLEVLTMEPQTKATGWAKKQLYNLLLFKKDIDLDSASDIDKQGLHFLASPGKVFLVTNTVLDKLSLLKCKYKNGQLDWSVFKECPTLFTATFILPNNEALRVVWGEKHVQMCLFTFNNLKKEENKAELWTHWMFIERENDYLACTEMTKEGNYIQQRSEYVYKLLAFLYLSDIEEEILKPGQSKGTKKTGKVINSFDCDITIVNSKWNTTTIREEGFGVSGYFAIRWTGIGRTIARIVMVSPFEKKGYVRKAKGGLQT